MMSLFLLYDVEKIGDGTWLTKLTAFRTPVRWRIESTLSTKNAKVLEQLAHYDILHLITHDLKLPGKSIVDH